MKGLTMKLATAIALLAVTLPATAQAGQIEVPPPEHLTVSIHNQDELLATWTNPSYVCGNREEYRCNYWPSGAMQVVDLYQRQVPFAKLVAQTPPLLGAGWQGPVKEPPVTEAVVFGPVATGQTYEVLVSTGWTGDVIGAPIVQVAIYVPTTPKSLRVTRPMFEGLVP